VVLLHASYHAIALAVTVKLLPTAAAAVSPNCRNIMLLWLLIPWHVASLLLLS
jgi:hypothetical protein